jgi:hypothetical protein
MPIVHKYIRRQFSFVKRTTYRLTNYHPFTCYDCDFVENEGDE